MVLGLGVEKGKVDKGIMGLDMLMKVCSYIYIVRHVHLFFFFFFFASVCFL